MNELAIIRKLAARKQAGSGVVRGIGDDCAILQVPRGHDLLVHTDLTIEDVHFRRKTHTARAIGEKVLARVVSDIAAMGGEPRWVLFSLVLPEWGCGHFLNDFYDGIHRLADQLAISVVGGDISRGKQFVADAVALGSVPKGKALRRDTAKPGDGIYVSGTLGHAAAGKYRAIPEPRIALGKWLRGRARACMDLSDGLAMDLHRLCWESGVAAEITSPLPVAPRATLQQALSGGEDYELLFTSAQKLPRAHGGLPLTRIGEVTKGLRGQVTFDGRPLKPQGWDPFV